MFACTNTIIHAFKERNKIVTRLDDFEVVFVSVLLLENCFTVPINLLIL